MMIQIFILLMYGMNAIPKSKTDFAVAQRERHTRAKHSSTRKPKNSGTRDTKAKNNSTREQKIAAHESKNDSTREHK